MNAAEYLARIGYQGPLDPSPETLAGLQRAHMLTVPFENLDIHLGRRLVLDRAANYDKIVRRRRGGWCYELNGMFSWLLEELGFRVTLLASRVEGATGAGREFAHLLLLVHLDRPYIADVGFGESSLDPIPLDDLPDHVIVGGEHGHQRVVFTLTPRTLEDFWEMCRYQQTSPESGFVRVRKITMARPDGRVTLRELVLSEWRDGMRSDRELAGEEEWHAALEREFGVVL